MTRKERGADLEELKKRLALREKENAKASRPQAPARGPSKRAPPAPEPPAPPVSFDDEMQRMGVAREEGGAERVVIAPRPEGPVRARLAGAAQDDASWEEATRGVVATGAALPGRSASLPTLDLHGFSEQDALAELRRFLALHRGAKARWVRVITGRGREGGGVLRVAVARWLKQSSAVASTGHAPPAEGGEGVTLVQLRRSASG